MKKLIAFTMVVATFGVLYVTAGTQTELEKTSQFDQAVAKGKTIVMFHATWCAACQQTNPHIKKLAKEKDVNVLMVDIDKHRDFSSKQGVQGVPTMKLFVDGKQVGKEHVGSLNYDQLVKKLANDFK